MADKPVSALPQVDSIKDAALFVLEQDGVSYKATAAQIKALSPAPEEDDESAETDLTGAVRYDKAQNLSTAQKTQARSNIGAVSSSDVTTAINAALGNYSAALSEMDEVIG